MCFELFQIIDEKSLIKKYQREISCLKQELDLLKRGIMENQKVGPSQDDLVNLKLQVCPINTHHVLVNLKLQKTFLYIDGVSNSLVQLIHVSINRDSCGPRTHGAHQ